MSGYKIEHQCPQCGAPAVLDETDRLFKCTYCRVQSYLLRNDYFRYFLPDKAPAGKKLFYVPYWRFKGMLFSSAGNTIHHRFIDASHQAVDAPCFPISVGLRSQTQKLKFVLSETKGLFLLPTQPFQKAMQIFKDRFSTGLPRPIYHQARIGETLSMIYAPFYTDDKIMDGMLNEPIGNPMPDGFDVADLILIANLPKVIEKSWETTDFHFWSSGFKVRHKDFLRLSRGLTLSQPRNRLIRKMPVARLHPVTCR